MVDHVYGKVKPQLWNQAGLKCEELVDLGQVTIFLLLLLPVSIFSSVNCGEWTFHTEVGQGVTGSQFLSCWSKSRGPWKPKVFQCSANSFGGRMWPELMWGCLWFLCILISETRYTFCCGIIPMFDFRVPLETLLRMSSNLEYMIQIFKKKIVTKYT